MKSKKNKVANLYIKLILLLSFIGIILIAAFSFKNASSSASVLVQNMTSLVINEKDKTPTLLFETKTPGNLQDSTKTYTPEFLLFNSPTPSPWPTSTATNPVFTNTPDFQGNIYHFTQAMDSVSSIAKFYGLSEDELREINWMRGNALLPGQKMLVTRGKDWLQQQLNYSPLIRDSMNELLWAYPSTYFQNQFALHFTPQSYPSVDPEALSILVENGLLYNEATFSRPFEKSFDVFVAGSFFEMPNQYLRGHSFGKDVYIVFLHDGSGDAIDQQYLAAHEVTHLYMWNTFGQPNTFLLSEGMAVWIGKSVTINSNNVPLEPFCKAFLLADKLPWVSDDELTYKGQNFDLENYYAAGCFIKYLAETYEVEKIGLIYPNANYENFYGKTLVELEYEWREYLLQKDIAISFDPQKLIESNQKLKEAYRHFFYYYFTSPSMVHPYIALDQARLALLSLRFDDVNSYLDQYYSFIN